MHQNFVRNCQNETHLKAQFKVKLGPGKFELEVPSSRHRQSKSSLHSFCNGMLQHAFATLEGEQYFVDFYRALLLSLFFCFFVLFFLFTCLGVMHACRPEAKPGACNQCIYSLKIFRGLIEGNPSMKNCGITLIIGKNKTSVDKLLNCARSSWTQCRFLY